MESKKFNANYYQLMPILKDIFGKKTVGVSSKTTDLISVAIYPLQRVFTPKIWPLPPKMVRPLICCYTLRVQKIRNKAQYTPNLKCSGSPADASSVSLMIFLHTCDGPNFQIRRFIKFDQEF